MDAREKWNRYVKRSGGVAALAEASGIPYPTITAITNGNRGIGRETANRLIEYDPSLNLGMLLSVAPKGK